VKLDSYFQDYRHLGDDFVAREGRKLSIAAGMAMNQQYADRGFLQNVNEIVSESLGRMVKIQ
jgi:hypothetical protein